MTLKLRNGKIYIEDNTTPERADAVHISYDYELGTNHYKTVLTVDGKQYAPSTNILPMYNFTDTVILKVELFDSHDTLMRVYEGTFSFMRLCLIGTKELIDIYDEVQFLQQENKELREKGDVI